MRPIYPLYLLIIIFIVFKRLLIGLLGTFKGKIGRRTHITYFCDKLIISNKISLRISYKSKERKILFWLGLFKNPFQIDCWNTFRNKMYRTNILEA